MKRWQAAPGAGRIGREAASSVGHRSSGLRSAPDPNRIRHRLKACPEIECIRHLVAPGFLAAAQLRAAEVGTGADQVLIANGLVSEEEYVQSLCRALEIGFAPLDDVGRDACPLNDDRLIEAAAAGYLPLLQNGRLIYVAAPRGPVARSLAQALPHRAELGRHLQLTTPARLQRFVRRHGEHGLAYRAAHALRVEQPDLSAGARPTSSRLFLAAGAFAATAAALWADARLALTLVDVALALIFLGWAGLRLMGLLTPDFRWRKPGRIADDELPTYSIIVALYREAAAVPGLVRSLAALDYPQEKLDIKFAVEADDWETRRALEAEAHTCSFEIVVAPMAGPRTKPKALNAALPFVRGSLVAVFDAEDRPERGQLHRAVEAFRDGDRRLACVQARLTIDNSRDSWITRMFTAEYAGLFDVFLPGLAAWRLPLPLGGSSNHFRTSVLREIGAWDPYNVTEDADLGMRLARHGYRTAMIASSTYEEAPVGFAAWLRQRTRWFKGWMQTWIVHMRRPVRLISDMGAAGFVVFQLVVGGTVLAALVHLVFAAALAWDVFVDAGSWSQKSATDIAIAALHGTTLITGYVMSGVLGIIGLARRRLGGCGAALLLMPVYWLMLSLACWRALFQLVVDPYRWEKTEHGLARSSRLRDMALRRAGFRGTSSVRPPPHRGSASY